MKFKTECMIEKVVDGPEGYWPQLQNVYFDADKQKLIATDGKHMAVVACEKEEGDTSGFISPEAIKEYRKQSKKSLVSLVANGQQKIGPFSLERPTAEQHGQFPNWEMVLPKADNPVTFEISFNASMLLELAQASGSLDTVIHCKFRGPLDVIEVEGTHGAGYLMPVRH
jgi:hypothetical protein